MEEIQVQAEMPPKIQISHINKAFKDHAVLKDVSLTCRSGEITGIIGRNGAGKTVLFKILCGLLTMEDGEIFIDGKKREKTAEMLPSAGVIIEEPAFLGRYSGMKNLEYLYMIRNKKNRVHLRAVMQKVGLDPDSKKHVNCYSLGMRQRLAIAQAIMEDPEILILDEPFNGLDNHGVEDMRQLFLELKKQGKTILVASHNAEDIRILCDQVYSMDGGVLTKVR
ncbi:MAG: ABC transporter ATP-binding protein [Lachnospiraceae bacterium]